MWEARVADRVARQTHTGKYAPGSWYMSKNPADWKVKVTPDQIRGVGGGGGFNVGRGGLGLGDGDITVVVLDTGGLYCDISLPILGWSEFSENYSLPIVMDVGFWDKVVSQFITRARSTCPVDTGFLRAHNDGRADDGGAEVWSEAEYSVYQEYGTSRMKAQPWFESSIRSAIAPLKAAIATRVQIINEIDIELAQILASVDRIRNSQQIDIIIMQIENVMTRLLNISSGMPATYRSEYTSVVSELKELIFELEEAEIELQQQEQQQEEESSGGGGSLLDILFLAIIMAVIELIRSAIFDSLGIEGVNTSIRGGSGESIHAPSR